MCTSSHLKNASHFSSIVETRFLLALISQVIDVHFLEQKIFRFFSELSLIDSTLLSRIMDHFLGNPGRTVSYTH